MSNCSWMTPKIIDPLHLSLISYFCYTWTSSIDHSSNLNRHSGLEAACTARPSDTNTAASRWMPLCSSWCTGINPVSYILYSFFSSLCIENTKQTQTDEGQLDFHSGCLHQLPYLPISTHTDSVVRSNGARCRLASWAIRYFPCKVPQTHRFTSGAAICGICDSEFCSRALDQNWAVNHQFSVIDWLQLRRPPVRMFWKRQNTKRD